MDYTSKTVRSRPGLTATEALVSLQSAPFFALGTKIAAFDERAGRWVAKLEIPKVAGPFPPSGDEGGEPAEPKPPKAEGGDEGPDDEDSPDGDPEAGPPGDSDEPGEKKKGDKPGSDAQVVDLLTQILHALGGGDPMGGMGGPDDLGPGLDGPPAPPPHGGPAGGPGAAPGPKGPAGLGAGRPLKPGEVPNKPGVTPVGAPAFSSTRTAFGADPALGAPPGVGGGPLSPGPNPMQPGAGAPVPGPTSQGGTGACSGCGGPLGPDGSCPTCGSGYMASLRTHFAKVAGRSNHLQITAPDARFSIGETVRAVKAVSKQYGYTVRQAKRLPDGRASVLLTVR